MTASKKVTGALTGIAILGATALILTGCSTTASTTPSTTLDLLPRNTLSSTIAAVCACRSTAGWFLAQTISSASAMPWPPPMHNVTMPRLQPSRFIEWIKRVANTAPLAPIGWP